jgi:hypothetical protein
VERLDERGGEGERPCLTTFAPISIPSRKSRPAAKAARFHLRVCRTCGHVGCCDQSRGKHATKHFHRTKHPIIEGYDPPEGWGWCYVEEVMFDLGDNVTAQIGPIPRYY